MKSWRVAALIPYPKDPIRNDNGSINFVGRIFPSSHRIGDAYYAIINTKKPDFWSKNHDLLTYDPALITINISSNTATEALEASVQILEDICNHFAFRLQSSIPILQLEIIDITRPVAIGESRDFLILPYPRGYKLPKDSITKYLGSSVCEKFVAVPTATEKLDRRDRALLRWYHKALQAAADIDRFIFLMIILEILVGSYSKKVSNHYTAACGHEIKNCPECNKPTAKVVNGPTIKKYLTDELCASKEEARDIWQLRQVVHGNNELTQEHTKKTSEVCRSLLFYISNALKARFNIHSEAPPFFIRECVGISDSVCLQGERQVTEDDLTVVHLFANLSIQYGPA